MIPLLVGAAIAVWTVGVGVLVGFLVHWCLELVDAQREERSA